MRFQPTAFLVFLATTARAGRIAFDGHDADAIELACSPQSDAKNLSVAITGHTPPQTRISTGNVAGVTGVDFNPAGTTLFTVVNGSAKITRYFGVIDRARGVYAKCDRASD
jgi:hypothetical protein